MRYKQQEHIKKYPNDEPIMQMLYPARIPFFNRFLAGLVNYHRQGVQKLLKSID
ncbi:hypothetical protein M948_06700 [Virgibacillus sp. CM-4]|nr:hypothetical protein M948_06700 [Virgibacillus sp. CM-4]